MSHINKAQHSLFSFLIFSLGILCLLLLLGSGNRPVYASSDIPSDGGWVFRPNEPFPALYAGAAAYSVPFETPPARGGIGPSLALSYNSRTVDGKVGWFDSNQYGEGWSLSGLPFITRQDVHYCTWQGSNQYHICFSGRYKLFLNGDYELVQVSGGCGANCTLYEAQDGPGLRVEHYSSGGQNTLGTYWIVRQPDGKVYRFGYYGDAAQTLYLACSTPSTCGKQTYRWYLDQLDDPFNNRMVVTYETTSAVSGSWACAGDGFCREVDIRPKFIFYNNTVPNPSRTYHNGYNPDHPNGYNPDQWKAKVEFHWEPHNNDVGGGWPIFRTLKYLSSISTHTRNENGVWWDKWRYNVGLIPFDCQGGSYCPNNAVLRVVDHIQRVEGNGQTWPETTFEYVAQTVGTQNNYCTHWEDSNDDDIPDTCTQTAVVNFQYPHLKRIRNGYGGVYDFTYSDTGQQGTGVHSWRLTHIRVWDGVKNVYGQDNPTRMQVFGYENPCYQEWTTGCPDRVGEPSYLLAGHKNTTIKTYEYDSADNQVFLSGEKYTFLVASDSGSYLMWGREVEHTRYADEALLIPLEQSESTWYLNTNNAPHIHAECPRDGLNAASFEWVCLAQVQNRSYVRSGPGSVLSHSNREEYKYETIAQGGRQWGFVTRTDVYRSEGGPDIYTHNLTRYATNTNGIQWGAYPRATGVWDEFWNVKSYTYYLYGSNTDPDGQVINRGDQLSWTRAVAEQDCDNGIFYTSDTRYTYGSYGLLETVTTFPDYGQQAVICGTDTLPATDLNRPGILSQQIQYKDYGMLVDWAENAADHRITYTYGGTTALYPWQVSTVTDPNNLTTMYRYDSHGRLQYVINPGDTVSSPSLEYQYFLPAGGPVEIREIIQPQGDNSERHETVSIMDGLGRTIETREVGASVHWLTEPVDLVTVAEYNGLGAVVCQTVPVVDPGNQIPCGESWPAHTKTVYDPLNRPVRSIAPDGNATTIIYGANSIYHQNSNLQLQARYRDPFGRLSTVDETIVTFSDSFDNTALPNWSKSGDVTVINNQLWIKGHGDWANVAHRNLGTSGDGGVSFTFSGDNANAKINFQIVYGTWDTDAYRRWGIDIANGQIQFLQYTGKSNTADWEPLIPFKSNTQYRAVLRTSQSSAYFSILVWEVNNPANSAELRLPKDDSWKNPGWAFQAFTYTDGVTAKIDDYQEMEFNRTQYGYDVQSNLVNVWDSAASTNNTQMAYDFLGRKTFMSDPDMGDWTYTYDPNGNLLRQGDGNGNSICFAYDEMNRLVRKAVADGVCPAGISGFPVDGPNHLASYVYDQNDFGLGKLSQVSWGSNTSQNFDTFHYDALGRLEQQTRTLDGRGYTMQTTSWDKLHRPRSVIYPNGELVWIGYDKEGENNLSAGSDQLVNDIQYNARGQMKYFIRGNGVDTTFNYYEAVAPDVGCLSLGCDSPRPGDGNFRLSQIQVEGIIALNYHYDKIGNIVGITDEMQDDPENNPYAKFQTFTYDSLNRLIGASTGDGAVEGYDHSYGYDPIGNIDWIDDGSGLKTYTYSATQPHAVIGLSNGQSFAYDANGNMIQRFDGTTTYLQDFDAENRLVSVDAGNGQITQFFYDASGQRVKTIKPDGTLIYTPFPNYEEEIRPDVAQLLSASTSVGSAAGIFMLPAENNGVTGSHTISAATNIDSTVLLVVAGLLFASGGIVVFYYQGQRNKRQYGHVMHPLHQQHLEQVITVLVVITLISSSLGLVGSTLAAPASVPAGAKANNLSYLQTSGDIVYISAETGGSVNGLSFSYGDILAYDMAASSWSIYFDGDDVSFCCNSGKNLDAFHMLADGSLLLSLNSNDGVSLPNVGLVDDSDVVRFVPSSLGENTAGTYELYFDGSDVGLTGNGEDIVSISVLPDDSLVISFIGSATPSGMGQVDDEDLVRFVPASLGANTSGTWEMYFDGSDVGLGEEFGEGVMGAWIEPVSGNIYLATRGTFNVPGLTGDENDIFRCVPVTLGDNTACTFDLYWEGELFGFVGEAISGLHLQLSGTTPPPTPTSMPPTPAMTPTATPNGNEAIHINFQLNTAPVPAGYLMDGGAAFADRGNGYSYGWNADNSSTGRDRSNSSSPDQRYDTLLHMQFSSNPNAEWEIAMPNGYYEVHVVAGDPDWTNSVYEIMAEGVTAVSGTPNNNNHWLEGTVTVNVADGRLTLSNGSGADNNKINFIDIVPVTTPPTATPGPTLTPTPTATPVAGDLSVTSLTLINADTDADIGLLNDGAVLDLSTLPTTNLNVRANVSGNVGSVRFELDGNTNFFTESAPPYALAGDNNGDYSAWTPALGDHILRGVPYSGADGSGSAGTALQVSFTVVDAGTPSGNGRVTDSLQALYTFTEGSGAIVNDVSGVSPALNLTISDTNGVTWLAGGGLSIDSNNQLYSSGPASKIIDAAKVSNEVTFEAWVSPANLTQDGPARIVSISADSGNRDMTLGQEADGVVGRVRTTQTSNNGRPDVVSPLGILTTEMHHLVFTRSSDGARTIYVDGVAVVSDTSLVGSMSNWNNSYQLTLANEFVDARPWLGTYHLVAVYGKALSSAEVTQNFNAGPTEAVTPPPYATATPNPAGGTISGHINRWADYSMPYAHAFVMLVDPTTNTVLNHTLADSNGDYQFDNVSSGVYDVVTCDYKYSSIYSGYMMYRGSSNQVTAPASNVNLTATGGECPVEIPYLEGPTILSIYAAGVPDSNGQYPRMAVDIEGYGYISSISVAGDPGQNESLHYLLVWHEPIAVEDVKIHLRNGNELHVDKIVLNGISYETEAPTTFSTGFESGSDCLSGNYQNEVLSCPGYFWYAPVIERVMYSIAGQTVAVRVTGDPVAENNGLHYVYSDHLGSATAMQAPDGSVTNTRYLPFGGYRSASSGSSITDRGFTGHKHNDELGLIYMNARYYVPGIGRFASADTIVPNPLNPQQLNRYSYALNSPLNFSDPSGHSSSCQGGEQPTGIGNGTTFTINCDQWVQDAVEWLRANGGNDGTRLAAMFDDWNNSTIKHIYVFANRNDSGMHTRQVGPWAHIWIGESVINETDQSKIESNFALFGHELEHIYQGSLQGWSIQGEIMAYQTEYNIREAGGVIQNQNAIDSIQYNPHDYNDLIAAQTGFLNQPPYNSPIVPLYPWFEEAAYFLADQMTVDPNNPPANPYFISPSSMVNGQNGGYGGRTPGHSGPLMR